MGIDAAFIAAQHAGNPRSRVLVVNPESSPEHIYLPELKDEQYVCASRDSNDAIDDISRRLADHVQGDTSAFFKAVEIVHGKPRQAMEVDWSDSGSCMRPRC